MTNNIRSLLAYFTVRPDKLFLIDGLGALASTVLLGAVLTAFQPFIGLPHPTLYVLAAVALVFSVYSLACFYFKPHRWRPYLAAIATANSLYSLTTAGLVVYFYPALTTLGVAYFAGELMVIGCLIFVETKVVLKAP
jgi:hypothetical protein